MKRVVLFFAFSLVVGACGAEDSASTTTTPVATTVSPNARVEYSTRTLGTIDSPVDLVERSPEDDWFYVVSQSGIIQQWSRDGSLRTTILDVSDVTSVGGERGLLGLAFRKTVDNTWQAFLNRTNKDGHTEITIADVKADGTFSSLQSPGELVLRVEQPYSNHNGGAVLVGPDNMLYVFMGDGGSGGDPERYAQNMNSLLGKILRIDPRPTGGYDIPVDNPFVTSSRPEIWSIGLRNPWRPTFDSFGSLWIADVGQNEWEEVHVLPVGKELAGRGANLGWSAYEGSRSYNTDVTAPNAINPVFEYPHSDGRCSISGGAVGNNTSTPGRAGWYFFSDYCSGEVRAILSDGLSTVAQEDVVEQMGNVTAVRATGNTMYILSADGKVRELVVVRS